MCNKEAEYGRAVNCNASDFGPMRGNIAYYENVGREKVVGERDIGPVGSVGSDGGIRRGVGGGR